MDQDLATIEAVRAPALPARLTRELKSRRMTAKSLAEKAHVHPNTLTGWKKEAPLVQMDSLRRVADVLGVEPSELVGPVAPLAPTTAQAQAPQAQAPQAPPSAASSTARETPPPRELPGRGTGQVVRELAELEPFLARIARVVPDLVETLGSATPAEKEKRSDEPVPLTDLVQRLHAAARDAKRSVGE